MRRRIRRIGGAEVYRGVESAHSSDRSAFMTTRAPSPRPSPAGRGRGTAMLLFVSIASVALGQQEPTEVRPPAETMRPEITGARGIVAGGRNFSVAAGLKMLQMGGNAADAGGAAVFAGAGGAVAHLGCGRGG